MSPVSTGFDCMNCGHRHVQRSCNFAEANFLLKKQSNRCNRSFIKNGSAIVRSRMGFMFNRISNIFTWQAILKIVYGIVVSIAIKMSNNMTFWSWAKKVLRYNTMNIKSFLTRFVRSFGATYFCVIGAGVWLNKKALTILNRCNPSKIADFVTTFIAINWNPNFRGTHG